MTKRERQEKEIVGAVGKLNYEDIRVLNLAIGAIISGGEDSERVARGSIWLKSPEGEKLSHSDTLKAIEAIATGNLDILADYLVDTVRDNVFCTKEAAIA